MEPYQREIAGKTILVTGGAGAIGSNLVRTLAALGARTVIVLDDFSAAFKWNVPSMDNVLVVCGSVTDDVTLKRVFQLEPVIVFHLAALFANQHSVDYPQRDLMVNGLGTLLVLQYAALTKVSRVVYTSSGCSIYGSAPPLPTAEDHVSLHLSSPYQITKMLGELYGNFFWHHYRLPVVKARLFNSYGPGEVPGQYRNVIPNFIYLALRGLPLPFAGSGDETRDFTYVDDVVDGLLRAAYFEAAVGEEINIASGCETRILDLAEQVNALCGNGAGIVRAERRVWDTKVQLVASIDRAHRLLGYVPATGLESGLPRTVEWFRSHWSAIERDARFEPGMSAAVRSPPTTAVPIDGSKEPDSAVGAR